MDNVKTGEWLTFVHEPGARNLAQSSGRATAV